VNCERLGAVSLVPAISDTRVPEGYMRLSRLFPILPIPCAVAVVAAAALTTSAPATAATTAHRAARAAATTSVMDWGDNSAGELGNGSLTAATTPVAVGGSAGIQAISSGGRHVLALTSAGTVLSWGDDASGQLGNGTASASDDAENPVTVPGLTGVAQVAAGTEDSLALLSDGTVMAWGDNSRGELGNGTTTSSDVPVAVPGLTGVTQVAAGGNDFSAALLSDGHVMVWGDGGNGELGDGHYANSDVPVLVKGLSHVTAIAAGGESLLALKSGGAVEAWGDDMDGQLGDGGQEGSSAVPVKVEGLTSAIAVSAGYQHSLALLSNGTVMAWGDNGFDQLGTSDGVGGIESSNVPVKVPGLSGVTAISAGGLFGLALLSGGTVDAWGDGAFGQLGDGTTNTVAPPTPVPGLTGASAIAAGGVSAAAVVSATAPAPPAPAPSIWQASPAVGPANVNAATDYSFTGVSAPSSTDVWAVGTREQDTSHPLTEHWNGTAWSTVNAPLPSGETTGSFNAVDALSPGNAWAVGTAGTGATTSDQSLIEHWNGQHWKVVPSPDPGLSNILSSISGTSPDDLWAAGWYENTAQTKILLLLLHWDGHTWAMFPEPANSGTIQFGEAVTVISAKNVWVVGDTGGGTLSAHWNGTTWTLVKTPFLQTKDSVNFLTGVTAVSPDDIWASGYEGNVNNQLFSLPYVLHWNGTAWSLTQLPNAGTEGSNLRDTVALSATDVWAVGITDQTDGGLLALTEHYNGTSWSISPALDPGQLASAPDNSLQGVASPAPGALWAVGAQEMQGQCCLRPLALTTSSG
jgi:alpha-tubulin suppressor-like RCC1 family protein